ncbi:MAG: LacI family DNA-binding transcriptional regulator [Acidobacteriaceae bacterium]
MPVRMKDIAKDVGVSIVTVSKVLRNHPDIAEETRARILKRVKELDYQPNVLARSLVTGRSYLIGLVVPDLLHPFFVEVAEGLSTAVRAQGYFLIVASSQEDPELEAKEILQLVARRLDALVVASTANSTESFERMNRMEQPFVLIDREFSGFPANFVGSDDEAAGRLATQHLIDQGCLTIAHIRGRNNSTGTLRFEGYRQTLLRNRLPYAENLVIARSTVDVDSTHHGYEAMRLLLKRKPRPDSVFCYNDPLAIGAMNAILDAGLRIPEDIALVGCGNLHFDGSLRVPLSSIDHQSRVLGERAGAILLNIFSAKARPQPVSVILNPALVVRASSAKAHPASASGRTNSSRSAAHKVAGERQVAHRR